jgi:hypothetical protein
MRSASSLGVTFQPTRRAKASGSISRQAPQPQNYVVRAACKTVMQLALFLDEKGRRIPLSFVFVFVVAGDLVRDRGAD